jgi:hypothetical protein
MEEKSLSEPKPPKTLRSLPREQAFYFFTSIGNYTGESAVSLEEFAKKILQVNVKSIEFHLYRGDFEKWITETLEENTLADKIKNLKELKPIGIDLRDRQTHHSNLHKTTIQRNPRYSSQNIKPSPLGRKQKHNPSPVNS